MNVVTFCGKCTHCSLGLEMPVASLWVEAVRLYLLTHLLMSF